MAASPTAAGRYEEPTLVLFGTETSVRVAG
jgi:hypothetical protein